MRKGNLICITQKFLNPQKESGGKSEKIEKISRNKAGNKLNKRTKEVSIVNISTGVIKFFPLGFFLLLTEERNLK